jgi:uncharacterized protein (DUF58 family)
MKQQGFRLRPTALWFILGPVLLCMWMAAVNFSNNLVYAILYLVGSLSLISVFHSWRNVTTLQVEHVRLHPAFAKEEVRMELFLRNPSKFPIYGLFFSRLGDESGASRRVTPLPAGNRRGVRIEPEDTCSVELVFPAGSRGLFRFEALVIRSAFPFGVFAASVRVPLSADYYVYPEPKGHADWPDLQAGGDHGSPASRRPGDDFAGVRAYAPGESLRHVDWKAFARGRPLSVKVFTGGAGHELWLNAGEMERLPLEARLSQLALWIVNAEKEEIPYALRIGRTALPLGLGPGHARRALEALAVAGLGVADA